MAESKSICKRLVYALNGFYSRQVETIEVDRHCWAFSGQVPCTGLIKCIYCGAIKENQLSIND